MDFIYGYNVYVLPRTSRHGMIDPNNFISQIIIMQTFHRWSMTTGKVDKDKENANNPEILTYFR